MQREKERERDGLLSGHINVNFHLGTCSPSSSQLRLLPPVVAEREEGVERRTTGRRRCCSTLFSGIINVTRHVSLR